MGSLFTADLDGISYTDVESFVDIGGRETCEGWRVDYKVQLPDVAKAVTAFANTYGGLLILGVDENNGSPVAIPGVPPNRGDLKTRISDIIRTSIQPKPRAEVGVAQIPGHSGGNLVAVVRIAEGEDPPYVRSQGQTNRIYVRRNDQTVEASRREIEELFAKRRAREERRPGGAMGPVLAIESRAGPAGTYFGVNVEPVNPVETVLDARMEAKFEGLLSVLFANERPNVCARDKDGTIWRNYAADPDIDRKWSVQRSGGTSFYTQASEPGSDPGERVVRLPIIAAEGLQTLELGRRVLRELDYWGRVQVTVRWALLDLKVLCDAPEGHTCLGVRRVSGVETVGKPTNTVMGPWSSVVPLEALNEGEGLLGEAFNAILRQQRQAGIDVEDLVSSFGRMRRQLHQFRGA